MRIWGGRCRSQVRLPRLEQATMFAEPGALDLEPFELPIPSVPAAALLRELVLALQQGRDIEVGPIGRQRRARPPNELFGLRGRAPVADEHPQRIPDVVRR